MVDRVRDARPRIRVPPQVSARPAWTGPSREGAGVSTLVVMAHYDADQVLRAHTRRTIQTFAEGADRVMVVSTSGIDEESHAQLPANVDFVTRPNFGYDFYSYKWGLDLVPDFPEYDHVVVSNDSFIGPSVPLDDIVEGPQAARFDFMGMTWSLSHGAHAQSFFFVVSRELARSRGFRSFWKDMAPVSDRMKVIQAYEIGLSRAVREAGFRSGAFFEPTDEEFDLSRRRFRHHADVRLHIKHTDKFLSELTDWSGDQTLYFNPACAMADRFLLDDRLPLLKFDTLRYDPYELDADRLLREAEAAKPALLDGVRDFLLATKDRYPFRVGENNVVVSPRSLRRSGLGYCLDPAFLAAQRDDAVLGTEGDLR